MVKPETQKQKRDKVKQIKERHENSKILPGTNDFEYLRNLMYNYPYPSYFDLDKIEYFLPMTNGNSIKPFIKIKGKPEEHFSLNSCITGRVNCDFNQVCRHAIQQQITDFRFNNTSNICGICKEQITDLFNTHIDHIYPLEKIIKEYFGKEEPETMSIQPHGRDFLNQNIKLKWQEHHKITAKLQIAHAKCNCSKSNKI